MTSKILAIAFIYIGFIFAFAIKTQAQSVANDSVKFDYKKIYALCLDANVMPAFSLIEYDESKKISPKDLKFKTDFDKRFKYATDSSTYLAEHKSEIDNLLAIFQNYWRQSILNTSKNYDTILIADVVDFRKENYTPVKDLTITEDSIDVYLKGYIENKGYYTTGFGKTGRLFDLLVWKTQKDTTYSFKIFKDKTSARVFMMDDFITLGWLEYATLNKHYPGGWATHQALFCVKKSYDLNSEKFLVSYLTHESRHFSDYAEFPKLKSADLEYRAKLTELSMAKKTLYTLIEFFITNANYNSDNGHSIANYCVIKDLSKALFGKEFEKDINMWKTISNKKINKTAYNILLANTKSMKLIGPDIERYIKK